MAFESEFKISLNIILKGNHKTLNPENIGNYLKRSDSNVKNIVIELVANRNLGSKVDQAARDQNVYRGIIKKALPNFMKGKTLKSNANRKKYTPDRFHFSIFEGDGYTSQYCGGIAFEGNKVKCSSRRLKNSSPQDVELDLSDPNFVEQLKAFYGEK